MSHADKKVPAKNLKKNEVKKEAPAKSKKTFKLNRFLIYLFAVILAGIVGLCFAFAKFFGSERVQRNASATLEFTYDGAAQNRTPSGEQFSIDAIFESKVLDGALARVGLNEKYTAEQIKNSMDVTGSYPSDVIDQIKDYDSLYNFSESRSVSVNNYYPTIYTVKLYDDFDPDVSDSKLDELATAIAEQYKDYFRNEYIYAFDMTEGNELFNNSNYDYSQIIKVLKNKLSMLKQYATEMYDLDTTFRYNGKTFNDIFLKCREIENDSLSNAEASIMINVLTVSSSRLQNQYEYEIKLLENEKTYKTENLDELNKLIDNYNMDGILYIGSGDSLIKVESNSKETYESLVDKKREISERLVEIDSEIAKYNEYLADLKAVTASSDTTNKKNEKIEGELTAIKDEVTAQQDSFKEMANAYNESIISEDSIVIRKLNLNDSKLFSFSFLVMVAKCAAPFCIIVMILCCGHAAFCELRKFKKENSIV